MNSSSRAPDSTHAYVLGHSQQEIDRLKAQARRIAPITERFFREAGVGPGMRVLDIGSGAGDVALLAREIVGDTGEVVGVDRVPAAIAAATARAAALSVRNVTFLEGDPGEMSFERPFDAVIGRYVLQFQKAPATMLRKLAAHARPGGVVVFHEIDWAGVASNPPCPTYDQCCRWCSETIRLSGTETRMGIKLHSTFVGAGLPAPSMRLEAVVGGGVNGLDVIPLVTDLVATLLPEMERLGVAKAEEVGLETLVERIRREVTANSSVIVAHYQIGAWARV